ncbi:MAG: acyltransferase [Methylophilaceae bacterium]
MKIDSKSSERIALLRFPMIIGIVFIHAYGSNHKFIGGQINLVSTGFFAQLIQDLLSQGVARLAVPMFFLISGYFFFLGLNWSISNYKKQIIKRFKSLVVPFLFWNLIVLIAYIAIQEIPAMHNMLSGDKQKILTYNMMELLNTFFGFTQYPIAYQFWFIRDLIIISIASPIVYYMVKKAPFAYILVLLALWLIDYWPIYIPSLASLLFFSIGAFLAINHISFFKYDHYGKVMLSIYILVLILDVLTKRLWFSQYVHHVGILFGLMSVLYLTSILQKTSAIKKILLSLSGFSFFVFAFHEPLLLGLKKAAYKIFSPQSDLLITTLYFACPIIVVLISMGVYLGVRNVAPKFLAITTGGR